MTAELILNRAEELREELIENRRIFHSFAETGFDLPRTTAFVEEKLRSYGLEPVRCGKALGRASASCCGAIWMPCL